MTTGQQRTIFVALEGLDGAGTTTQTLRLVQWLSSLGRDVLSTREPSDGPVGRLIRQHLRGSAPGCDAPTMALLFAADRMDHLEREVRPARASGRDVVSDRYVMSSLAYQGLKGQRDWVEQLNCRADEADLTLLIEVPVATCLERLNRRGSERELYEQEAVLTDVAAAYQDLAAGWPEDRLCRVDGNRPVDEVTAAICRAVEPKL